MTPTPSPSTRIQDIIANILNTLEVIDRANLTKSEILRLGVPFEAFDPNDEDSLDPETPWLFKPIPKEDIKPWKISASKAESVLRFITAQFNFRRKSKTRLRDTFGWNDIDFEEFAGGNEGFLLSTSGQYRGVDTPGWRTCLIEEWWDGEVLVGPSVRFIICTEGNGKECSLLLSELGSIAQVVAFRRTQPEFKTCRLFPASTWADHPSLLRPARR
ncbi:hypothetical protein PENNAL_c0029G06013 [Penicillium nalgiovense]|uniref:Uncharacterized protein n=1 Tax=Penicillium nalgiovense TaxID=60175 RepID=A0A1V6Y9Q4_PENNA|nr:hypothetical protein PENNAL_c0029G06013 [Penicillium nalgiovense]